MGPTEQLDAIREALGDLPQRLAAALSVQRNASGQYVAVGTQGKGPGWKGETENIMGAARRATAAASGLPGGGILAPVQGGINTYYRVKEMFDALGDLKEGLAARNAGRPPSPAPPAPPFVGPPRPTPQPVQPGFPAPLAGPNSGGPTPPVAPPTRGPGPTPTPTPNPTGGPTPPVPPTPWINTLGPPPTQSPAAFAHTAAAPRPTPTPIAPAGPGAVTPIASAPARGGSDRADKSTEALEDLEEDVEKLTPAVEKLTASIDRLITKMESRQAAPQRPSGGSGGPNRTGATNPIGRSQPGGFTPATEPAGGAAPEAVEGAEAVEAIPIVPI